MLVTTCNFFGAILGGLTAIGSAIAGALSTAGAWIATTAVKVGTAIAGFAKNAIGFIGKIVSNPEELGKVLTGVSNVFHGAAAVLGIDSKEDPEELGAKAMQADKSIEDFDYDTEKYIKYLNEEIKLDKEKFDKMSATEKMAARATGMALEAKAIEDKLGMDITPEFSATIAKIKAGSDLVITGKELAALLTSIKESGITTTNDVVDVLLGEGSSDRVKTEKALIKAVSSFDNVTDPDAYIEAMKDTARKEPDNNGNS